jgi:hypothetical protein
MPSYSIAFDGSLLAMGLGPVSWRFSRSLKFEPWWIIRHHFSSVAEFTAGDAVMTLWRWLKLNVTFGKFQQHLNCDGLSILAWSLTFTLCYFHLLYRLDRTFDSYRVARESKSGAGQSRELQFLQRLTVNENGSLEFWWRRGLEGDFGKFVGIVGSASTRSWRGAPWRWTYRVRFVQSRSALCAEFKSRGIVFVVFAVSGIRRGCILRQHSTVTPALVPVSPAFALLQY